MRRRLELLLVIAALGPVSALESCQASASLTPILCNKRLAPTGVINPPDGDDYTWDCTSAANIELGQIVPVTIQGRINAATTCESS